MNGRIYDPLLGRFLSADPVVQAPNNLQSYNRYSYVLNNPLSLTDPTGFTEEDDKEKESEEEKKQREELFKNGIAQGIQDRIAAGTSGNAIPAISQNNVESKSDKGTLNTQDNPTQHTGDTQNNTNGETINPPEGEEREIDELDILNRKVGDEAWAKLPGTMEKLWAILELTDLETGEKSYIYSYVNAKAKEVGQDDVKRLMESFPLEIRTRYRLNLGCRKVSSGHTHPGNNGPSSLDVNSAIERGKFGIRSYLRTVNGNLYEIRTSMPYKGWDKAVEGWLWVDTDKYSRLLFEGGD